MRPLSMQLVSIGGGILAFTVLTTTAQGATYTVTSVNDSGSGTLREAIMLALSNSEPARIEFAISGDPPFVIKPKTKFPPITVPVTIDGTTQPQYAGAPCIELNGSGFSGDGLMLSGGRSTVRGLAITRCTGAGIRLSGLSSNVIQGNYIGVDTTGLSAAGNSDSGIVVYRSRLNLIGGTTAAEMNVISGGNFHGIQLVDSSATSNTICGNLIGTDKTGLKAVPNKGAGILLNSAPNNLIGGTAEGARNVISGNGVSGIFIFNVTTNTGNASNNVIQGNYIGVNISGTAALSNTVNGVHIYSTRGNIIGGTTPGARNIISGNGGRGIILETNGATGNLIQGNYVGTDVTGSIAIPNQTEGITVAAAPGNQIGGTSVAARNLISGNNKMGIALLTSGSSNTWVCGNYIGVNASGTQSLPNKWVGVDVEAPGAVIGGTDAGAGNLISGNSLDGIFLADSNGSYATIQGNYIGTDASGKTKLSNGRNGIFVQSTGNTIGGSQGGANLISGNTNNGIFISGITASNNVIMGNFIGTDINGTAALGNRYSGISITNTPMVYIGGTNAASRNIISGNSYNGVDINGRYATLSTVQGNYIGTDVTGTAKLPNGSVGVYISSAVSNLIGGAVLGAGNLISGNTYGGMYLTAATNNFIQGNFIGTQADGTSPLANGQHVIELDNSSFGNVIGGDVEAADNHIAYAPKQYDGIRVRDTAKGNFISRNSFFSNGNSSVDGLGIDTSVNGVTTNGMVELSNCTSSPTDTSISGTLHHTAGKTFLLQFYANAVTNYSGYGEGLVYLGALSVTTDSKGVVSFTATLPVSISTNQYVSATVTDSSNTTGEFSKDITVQAGPSMRLTPTPASSVSFSSCSASLINMGLPLPSQPILIAPTVPTNNTIEPKLVSSTQGEEVFSLVENGPMTNRVNVVFLAEGYTAADEAKFLADATQSFQNMFSSQPYLEYQYYYNAYAIFVASEQSGSTHKQYNLNKHTYFNSSYDADTDRIVTIPPNSVDSDYSHGRGKVDALIAKYLPQSSLPVVLVNDYVDGGAGGPLAIISMGPTGPETLMHEAAHTLSGLGDEYESSGVTDFEVRETPNTTQETRRNYIKWNNWIDASTPIPTTIANSNSIGLFLGANYSSSGWYRPKYDCRMRSLTANFCEVCMESLVLSTYTHARPVDKFFPATNKFTVTADGSGFLAAQLQQPAYHRLTVKWLLNGNEIVGETNEVLKLNNGFLTNGTQTITVVIHDPTSLVRTDTSNLLSQTFEWTITGVDLPSIPVLVSSPTNQTVYAGSTVQMSATVTGRDPIYYQWRFNNNDLQGETNNTLILPHVQPNQAGGYSLMASNADGRVFSSNAVLTVMVPVTVSINGSGSVTPSNVVNWFIPGQTCKLTAKAATGCTFTGWTGSLVTNKAAIQFKVLAPMELTANFKDPIKPTLIITSPANGIRLTNYPITVTGTAKDNAGVNSVQFRVNGGEFAVAVSTNGWTNWTATFTPRPGTNLIEVASYDKAGNSSATAKRTLVFVSLQTIELLTNGYGSITPNMNGQLLEVGKTYKFTAVAARSNLFAGWSTGIRTNVLSVVMETNLSLTASFVTNPFSPLKGNYEGLALDGNNHASNAVGTVKVTVTDQGKFSGRLIGADTYTFSSAFWIDGTAQVQLNKAKRSTLTLSLQLDLTNGTESITGSLTDGNWTVPVQCDLDVYDGKNTLAPQAGVYTIGFLQGNDSELPLFGDGFGTVTIKTDGSLRFSGTLPDGTTVTQTTVVSRSGEWPLFGNLYLGRGSLAGWLQFTNLDSTSMEGSPVWIKQTAKTGVLATGVTNTLTVVGSTYNAKARPVLSLSVPQASFWGAGFETPWIVEAKAANTNGLFYSGTNGLSLTVAPASGLITGKITAPSIKTPMTIKGVVLQQGGAAVGYFQNTNLSGRFELQEGAH